MSNDYPRSPIPEAEANRPASAIAMVISNAIMGVPVMILGASIGGQYGTDKAWIVILLGCALTAAFAALMAHAGVMSRRSTALLARAAFGTSGAHFLNLAIAIALLGWLAVELGFIGSMIADGVHNVVGVEIGRTPGILLASLLITGITVAGIALISRVPLLFLPVLIALLLCVLFLAFKAPAGQAQLPQVTPSIGTGVSAIVGGYIVGCLIMPDYSRFVRTSRSAMCAAVFALGPTYALVLGAYAFAGLVTQSTQPGAILLALGFPKLVGLVLPVGLMQNAILGLYSGSLATATIVKSLSFRTITIGLMLIGLVLALAGADSFFVDFLVMLGVIFPPAVALLIAAGLFGRPDDADTAPPAWQGLGLAVWCFGIACGACSEWLGFGVTGFSAFDGFIGAAAALLLAHLLRKTGVLGPIASKEF